MRRITRRFEEEHRVLEERLDALEAAIVSGDRMAESLASVVQCAHQHYRREQPFLDRLANYQPALAHKLSAQHEEACEIAVRFEEALTAGQSRDMLALARRFHAIVQHNIIEEERDVFPVANRCLSEAEQQELLARPASP